MQKASTRFPPGQAQQAENNQVFQKAALPSERLALLNFRLPQLQSECVLVNENFQGQKRA